MRENNQCRCPQCGKEFTGEIETDDPCPIFATLKRDGKAVKVYRQKCWECMRRVAAPAFQQWLKHRSGE